MRTVGIVGLGLIGGSLARDLLAAGWGVHGTDRDPETLRAAALEGVVPRRPDGTWEAGPDLLVLAVPVRAAAAWLRDRAGRIPEATVVTDVASTKSSVVAAAAEAGIGGRFVGSHPMAGLERSGWAASRQGLFRNADVWVCEGAAVAGAVHEVEALWRRVGGRPLRIGPEAHDRLVAFASHLPQLGATALARVLGEAGIGPDLLGPGGRDCTRLAGSDPDVWMDVLADNAERIAPAVESLVVRLSTLLGALRSGDAAALRSVLEAGRSWSRGGPGADGPGPGSGAAA